MAAPTRGREDDGRDLVGSGDPGRTGRGGAGRVRSILGANQGWARLCGYGHMFSPGCEWLQSLCSAHPAWASSLVPSPFLHPPSTPPPRPLSWTLGISQSPGCRWPFRSPFPDCGGCRGREIGAQSCLSAACSFHPPARRSPGRFLSVLPPAKGQVGALVTPGSSPFPRPPGWRSSPAPPERTNAGTCK